MSILKTIGVFLANFFVQFFREWKADKKGQAEGREDAAQEAQAKTIETAQKAKDVKNEVKSLGADDLKHRAGRWVRSRPKDGGTTSDK